MYCLTRKTLSVTVWFWKFVYFFKKRHQIWHRTSMQCWISNFGCSKRNVQRKTLARVESLQQRLWYRKLYCLFKIINNQSPWYLFKLFPSPNTRYFSRNSENIPQLRKKGDFSKNSFFSLTIKEWNNMDPQIRKSKSISIFKSNILKFIRPKPNNVYYCHNTKKIKLLTRLRLGLRYFCELKFKHSFQDCLNPLWLCGNEIETSIHYLLHCPTYTNERLTLLNKI